MTLIIQPLVFACHDASCRPPTSGGTGGSRPSGGGSAGGSVAKGLRGGAVPSPDSELDLLFPGRGDDMTHKKVYADGTLSVEGLNEDGSFKEFSPSTEKRLQASWDEIGPTKQQYEDNFVIAGKLAMGIDPSTGKVDLAQAAEGRQDSKWYTVAHADCKAISDETGIPMDSVVAATATLSAGRLWSGVANGNIETARNLAKFVRDNPTIKLEQQHLDFIAARAERATKEVGRVGLTGFPPKTGDVRLSELNSGQAVEALYAINAMRGYSSYGDWAKASTKDGVVGAKTPPMHSKIDPPFPFFTSKGTNQVKQALAVLRGEVSLREAISGPKYSSFFSNIIRPDKDYSSTNDTWHYRIMAGNLTLNYKGHKGNIQKLTIAEKAGDTAKTSNREKIKKAPATSQDIFQRGTKAVKDNLEAGDGMFRDTTKIARNALNRLKSDHPETFGDMKIHEFQALIWVYYGGGLAGKNKRMARWNNALAEMEKHGQ